MLETKPVLENESVLLRPLTEKDLSLLRPLASDPELWVYFTHDLSVPREFDAWAEAALSGERLQFIVWSKTGNRAVGSTALGNYSARDSRIEIGWTWLAGQFQGTGINKSMKLLMLAYCFESLHLKRVEIKTDVLNMPARKALLKLGAVEEGILRSHTQMTHNRRRDTIYYSILDTEWEHLREKSRAG